MVFLVRVSITLDNYFFKQITKRQKSEKDDEIVRLKDIFHFVDHKIPRMLMYLTKWRKI
jgi:hypothetical protein